MTTPNPIDLMKSAAHLYRALGLDTPREFVPRGPVLGAVMPFSLTCRTCDAGSSVDTPTEASLAGWDRIEPARDLPQANYIGDCPECLGEALLLAWKRIAATLGDAGKCRSCGAEIRWARTKNDKAIPIDADYPQSHFASCPNSRQHRRPKQGDQP